MRSSYLLLLVLLLAASATLLLVEPSDARTIIVDDDWNGADHNTIRAAIAAASDGDTIRVYVKITEKSRDEERSRVQPFEGVVVKRSGGALNETVDLGTARFGDSHRMVDIHISDDVELVLDTLTLDRFRAEP